MAKLPGLGKPAQRSGTFVRGSDPSFRDVLPSSSGTSGTDWRLYRLETQRRNRPGWLRFPSLTCRNPQTPRDAAHRVATGKGWGKAVAIEQAPHAINSAKAPATNGIYYHGGPARDGEPFLHLRRLVRQLCDGLGGKFYSQ